MLLDAVSSPRFVHSQALLGSSQNAWPLGYAHTAAQAAPALHAAKDPANCGLASSCAGTIAVTVA
jgi:hypothetical protein